MQRANSRKRPWGWEDWRQEKKWMTKDEMVEWHHWLNGHEFEQAPRDGETWRTAVHGVAKSQIWLSDWTTTDIYTVDLSFLFLVTKWCLTLLQLHGLEPARLLCPWDFPGKNMEWVAISFSKWSSWPRDGNCVFCIGRWILYPWVTREAL